MGQAIGIVKKRIIEYSPMMKITYNELSKMINHIEEIMYAIHKIPFVWANFESDEGIELNKEQINIIRLLNSKIRLEAKKQGLNGNILQVAVHNEFEKLVVHHDTGYIEVVTDTNLLNTIDGIVIKERKKKKVKLFEKMPICPLCKDEEKKVFYFEPDDIWVCRNCHNEFKYKYNGIEEY